MSFGAPPPYQQPPFHPHPSRQLPVSGLPAPPQGPHPPHGTPNAKGKDPVATGLFQAGLSCVGVGLVLPILFVALDILMARPFWTDWALDSRGVATEAEPVSFKRLATGDDVGADQVSYRIEVRYDDEDGEEHESHFTTMDAKVIRRAVDEEPIDIEYDPREPDVVRAEGEPGSTFGTLPLLLLAFFPVGVVLLVVAARRRRQRQQVSSSA